MPTSEQQFENDATPGDEITYRAEDPARGTPDELTLTNRPLVGTIRDVRPAEDTLDLFNPTLVFRALAYGPRTSSSRYIVDGGVVTFAAFEAAIEDPTLLADAIIEVQVAAEAGMFLLTLDP